MKSSTVKYIFFGILLFVLIGIIYTNSAGEKQAEVYKEDFGRYQQAVQLIQTNQLPQAIKALEQLVVKHPDEYKLYYQLGLAYSGQKDFKKAALCLQKAIDIRPALLEDQTFTFKMGESLYHIKQLDLAKAYLEKPVAQQFQAQKDELLQLIEKELQS
ncbi:tetratricopeptide repeat protein [Schinkia azotoformans]|uniref:tetratricopeptide repeat protein n=1 Tax=Schinkia azotoformans TaxID=1454 RepID=UPI002DBD53A2|nr:tetratricopeptide repeat protein [Schinkia azotoformans]MEC1714807.1 tetratricopeptide repeat protein [Schinkia azotoformans]MEC1741713.1 tetratricopeptide repeat protein [Schinkia azotoformans]MEC1766609.1 tetratricopeptide repeat protein [Schinkia azotoformans]MEC1788024.1 tetratricopeptide repeat protein [Schinkia azotoformans]MED4375410.1 tetratricopeptide repeat protein [Schinkia azotoformans]